MVLKCVPVGLVAARPAGARVPPKAADSWYATPEHRAWAVAVIARDGGRCRVCNRRGRLFADHIVEIEDGGARLDLANGQALCGSHHTAKTAAARAARFCSRAGGMGV